MAILVLLLNGLFQTQRSISRVTNFLFRHSGTPEYQEFPRLMQQKNQLKSF